MHVNTNQNGNGKMKARIVKMEGCYRRFPFHVLFCQCNVKICNKKNITDKILAIIELGHNA